MYVYTNWHVLKPGIVGEYLEVYIIKSYKGLTIEGTPLLLSSVSYWFYFLNKLKYLLDHLVSIEGALGVIET